MGLAGGIRGNRRFLAVGAREKIRDPAAAAFGSFSLAGGAAERGLCASGRGGSGARGGSAARSGFDAPGRYRLGGAVGTDRSRLRNVVCAAGARHDFAQRLERLDLIGDGTPHAAACCAVSCGNRGATAQDFAGRFEFALDLARHIAQLRRRGLETFRGLPENASELRIGLLAGSAHRRRRALALLLYIGANAGELPVDHSAGGLRGFGQEGADVASARRGFFKRVLDTLREGMHQAFQVFAAHLDAVDERFSESRRAVSI